MTKITLSYDLEDLDLNEEQLEDKYGDVGHPKFTQLIWIKQAKANPDNSYYAWVHAQLQNEVARAAQPDPEDTIVLADNNQFAAAMLAWHKPRVAELTHLMEMPDDGHVVTITVDGVDTNITLTGDTLKGFKAGLITALAAFDTLPFVVEVEEIINGTNPAT